MPVCFLNEVEKPATVSKPTFFASSSINKSESAGYRIELGDIEQNFLKIDGINEG